MPAPINALQGTLVIDGEGHAHDDLKPSIRVSPMQLNAHVNGRGRTDAATKCASEELSSDSRKDDSLHTDPRYCADRQEPYSR